MSIFSNEQTKLTATYVNGLAIALAAVGGIAPWIGVVQGGSAPVPVIFVCSFVCIGLSVALHSIGRVILRSLSST